MKKLKYLLGLLIVLIVVGGCGNSAAENTAETEETAETTESTASEDQTQDDDVQVYRVGVVSDRASEIWEDVNSRLTPAENIRVETVLFSDYVNPNVALLDGSIDANAYQYIPFLSSFNEANDSELMTMGYLSVEPMGIWSQEGIDTVEDVPEGATVAVIEDPSVLGNSLVHMEKAGLITIEEGAGSMPTLDQIAENPLNLNIVPMENGMVVRSIEDAELIVSGATAAMESGLTAEESFYFEDTTQTSPLFRLNFVTRPELLEDEGLQTALDYYQTQETVDYANETGEGTFYPGWDNDDDAREDYLEYEANK